MEEYNAKAEDEIMRYCWMEGYLRLYSLVVGYDPLTYKPDARYSQNWF